MHMRRAGGALSVLLLAVTSLPSAAAAAPRQQLFASPEAAVDALVAAARTGDSKAMLAVLGPEAKRVIDSGDPVTDQKTRDDFVRRYDEAHSLLKSGDEHEVLQVGADDWPLPIPLIKTEGGWRFDAAAAQEEILARRIGKNELAAIQVCLAYVAAQREYSLRNPTADTVHQYAQYFTSTPGKRDGLFWETADTEEPAPLGPLIAGARGEGYQVKHGERSPYHGYYYKILKAQGPDAEGGKYDYVVRGKMIGGFALVAYPAQYGASGVTTFLTNHDGVVFQKDLGSKTAAIAQAMTTFSPDSTWSREPTEDEKP